MDEPRRRPRELITPDGTVTLRRVGLTRGDLYHFLLTACWAGLLGTIAGFFAVGNAAFALLYVAGGDCIGNARPGTFADAFFFSVLTMATIGCGAMTPVGPYANVLASFEAVFGILLSAPATGIPFAKFSAPRPRVERADPALPGAGGVS